MRGMGRIFKRGEIFWIAYSHRAKEYRESSGSTRESQARRLLKNRLGEIQGNKFVGPSQERLLFSELLDGLLLDYRNNGRKSLATIEFRLKAIRDAFGLDRAMHVTEARIERYKAERLAEGKAPATVNRELAAIRRAFRLGVKQKRITTAPAIEFLREQNVRQGFFERADFHTVMAHLPADLQDFASFAYLTAWRRGEIASLTWPDVDRNGRVIRLRPEASKNNKGRLIALEGELWDMIERRWAARQIVTPEGGRIVPWVFHRAGRPIRDIRGAWKSACAKAGVTGRLFHDLRRSGVRAMIRAGVPERVAMEISGHRTRAVFDRYNITSERDIREAVQKTQAYINAQPTERTVVPLREAVEGATR